MTGCGKAGPHGEAAAQRPGIRPLSGAGRGDVLLQAGVQGGGEVGVISCWVFHGYPGAR